MTFDSLGPLGKPLGGLLGRVGRLLDRLRSLLGRLGGILGEGGSLLIPLDPSWKPSWSVLVFFVDPALS